MRQKSGMSLIEKKGETIMRMVHCVSETSGHGLKDALIPEDAYNAAKGPEEFFPAPWSNGKIEKVAVYDLDCVEGSETLPEEDAFLTEG